MDADHRGDGGADAGDDRMIAALAAMFVGRWLVELPPRVRQFGVAAILLGSLLAVIITRVIVRPVKEMERVIEQVRDGDLTVRVPVRGNDETMLVRAAVGTRRAAA